ncbi:MAG: hypothetical protein ACI959_001087 [Limisphaerales bacterium]|jgi:hypothetical protein
MKKFSSILFALVMCSGLFAQQQYNQVDITLQYQPQIDLEDRHFIKEYPSAPAPALRTSGSRALNFTPLGTSYNIFSVLTNEQNQVAYNAETGSIVFVHRQNDGTTGGSGGMAFDASFDEGDTWPNINTIITPDYNLGTSTSLGNRYPSITIYNPSGNTDPANAYIASSGPALDDYTPLPSPDDLDWGLQSQHSANMSDGSNVSEFYWDGDYFTYGLMTNVDGVMWSTSTSYDGPQSGTTNFETVYINRGDWNATTNSVDWTKISIDPMWDVDGANEKLFGFSGNIDFGPDGMTGYAVIVGGSTLDVTPTNIPAYIPCIYKTTDGGANWNRLPSFDYLDPAFADIQDYLIPTGAGDVIPSYSSIDVVVDEDDRLNFFAQINPRSNTGVDSIGFIWVGDGISGLFHCSTTDGTDWAASLVDTVILGNGELVDANTVQHGPGVQLSKTEDGSRLFFSWAESNPDFVTTNILPNIRMRGYRVSDGEWTYEKNVTDGSGVDGICFYPMASRIAMESGTEQEFQIPLTFAEPNASGPTSPPQYYYLGGAGFDEADFGALAAQAVAAFTVDVVNNTATFTNGSSNAADYIWDFGDASSLSNLTNPTHLYSDINTYNVCLTAKNDGTPTTDDVYCEDVDITSIANGIENVILNNALNVFPSPTNGMVNVVVNSTSFDQITVEVYNMIGELVTEVNQVEKGGTVIDLSNLSNGQYIVKVAADNAVSTRTITVAH